MQAKETYRIFHQQEIKQEWEHVQQIAIQKTYKNEPTYSNEGDTALPISPLPAQVMAKQDVIVLCVELSGRVLLTGKNGIFSLFVKEMIEFAGRFTMCF